MLRVERLEVSYGDLQVLWGASLEVREAELVCLLGPNGAGKSTLVNTITSLVSPQEGRILFHGDDITHVPTHQCVELGIAHVLERRRLFLHMTVLENLLLGSYNQRGRAIRERMLDRALELFPILAERRNQLTRSLSGGEQQMCAIARGLMSDPKLLIVDEPFLGLAPGIVERVTQVFQEIRSENVSVLFVEQNVEQALECSDRGYVLELGRIVLSGSARDLLQDSRIRTVYLGL